MKRGKMGMKHGLLTDFDQQQQMIPAKANIFWMIFQFSHIFLFFFITECNGAFVNLLPVSSILR